MSDLVAFDVETTMNAPDVLGKANPMHTSNKIVMQGLYDGNSVGFGQEKHSFASPDKFYAGHNISFDLKYAFKHGSTAKNGFQKARIWDTQLAEYVLTGQQTKWSSLNDLCLKYGLPVKDSRVTEYFDKGLGADHVPIAMLTEYLEHDLRQTYRIAETQIAEAVKLGVLPLLISQMEALHATTEMTYNGLFVDEAQLQEYTKDLESQVAGFYAKAGLTTRDLAFYHKIPFVPEITSNTQLSKFLFGGEIVNREAVPVGMYKNGKVKTKMVDKKVKFDGVFTGRIRKTWYTESGKNYSVNDTTLKEVKVDTSSPTLAMLIDIVLAHREASKIYNTYCLGISKLLYNNYIYAQLNHTGTVTGRLSSSNPNLQNLPNIPFKRIFTSRYGEQGVLVEFDFAQLEVVILAYLSQDTQLRYDINNDVDIHTALFWDMYSYKPTKEQRKAFKPLTFGLLYGAGVNTLAQNAHVTIDEAKTFVATFYKRYPGVQAYHDAVVAKANREATTKAGGLGEREYNLQTVTGRYYHLTEYASDADRAKYTGRAYSFSPTELKNYPVQGMATGDIVPLMLGILFREVTTSGKYTYTKMINTIHDSILFDSTTGEVDGLIKHVVEVLRKTPVYFEKTFNIPFNVKLDCGCSTGKNWFEMNEVNLEDI